MQGVLYEEVSAFQFVLVSIVLGGAAAWMTGKACAETWRTRLSLAIYLLLLGGAVRFVHHALFEGTMFTAQYYAVDTAILLVLGFLGFQYTRAGQMVNQYYWLYERDSPLSWRERS